MIPVETSKMHFAICDVLQIKTAVSSNGTMEANAKVSGNFGLFRMDFPVRARSDYASESKQGTLIHYRGHLWAYLWVAYTPEAEHPVIYNILFDGDTSDFPDLSKRHPHLTVERLKKRIVGVYSFDGQKWHEAKVEDFLDMVDPAKGFK